MPEYVTIAEPKKEDIGVRFLRRGRDYYYYPRCMTILRQNSDLITKKNKIVRNFSVLLSVLIFLRTKNSLMRSTFN